MTQQERTETYYEANRMAASMTKATQDLRRKLKTLKQPMTPTGRQAMLRDVAEIRGYVDVLATLVVCAR